MGNENQSGNDHHLHIESCLCGNSAPGVSGDDFDGEVDCPHCFRDIIGYGTRGAITIWNRRITEHRNGVAEFPRCFPCQFQAADMLADKLAEDAAELERDVPEVAIILRGTARQIRKTIATARQTLLAREPAFHPQRLEGD